MRGPGWFLSISKQLAVDYKVAAVVVYVFSVPWKEVLPFYISGAISQMRNISLLEIKFVVPHTSPSYSNNTLKGGAATDDGDATYGWHGVSMHQLRENDKMAPFYFIPT